MTEMMSGECHYLAESCSASQAWYPRSSWVKPSGVWDDTGWGEQGAYGMLQVHSGCGCFSGRLGGLTVEEQEGQES